jgi:hypothetical protein
MANDFYIVVQGVYGKRNQVFRLVSLFFGRISTYSLINSDMALLTSMKEKSILKGLDSHDGLHPV